jgi:amino acid adenylation domain-containing protein
MSSHFNELLSSVVTEPEQKISLLKLLPSIEKEKLQTAYNATSKEYSTQQTLPDLFEEQVSKTPEELALTYDGEELTYKKLNEQANQLAQYLLKQGIKQGQLVPVCIERSTAMIIGVLAILKAGGVYVPIDPEYPSQRIKFMLEDSAADLIVSSKDSKTKLGSSDVRVIEVDGSDSEAIKSQPSGNLTGCSNPDQLAYVIYTSGSTGVPKGVCMPASGLLNLLNWQEKQFVNKKRRVLQFASLTFDVSFQEIFSTLCFGSTLYLISENRRKDMSAMLDDVGRYKITHLFVPYIVLKSLVEYASTLSGEFAVPEEIIVAGEQLKLTDDIQKLVQKKGVRLVNQYGPTEAHVVSSYTISDLDLKTLPPIGKPIDNTQLYVLDTQQQLCPISVPGELYIGGMQVARGYHNRQELTAEKFISDPFSSKEGSRLYRTGDLARWLPDGNIEYLGRIDDQVKVRGYRIELGEIESVLQQSGLITQGVVVTKDDLSGNKRLAGYVVSNGEFDKQAVISYLQGKLPEYMVPALWVELEKLPITPNGKIDKKALPHPDMSSVGGKEYVKPKTETERKLAEIWQELLGTPKISIHDNFFELGGHSLMVMKLVSHIKNKLMITVPIHSVFQFSTVHELSNYLEMTEDDDTTSFEEITI